MCHSEYFKGIGQTNIGAWQGLQDGVPTVAVYSTQKVYGRVIIGRMSEHGLDYERAKAECYMKVRDIIYDM